MDISALKPYFGKNVLVASGDKQFVGTLEPVPSSPTTVTLQPLSNDIAENYEFAINGVALLSADSIAFLQTLK